MCTVPCSHSKIRQLQLLSITWSHSNPQHLHKLASAKWSLITSPPTQNTVTCAQTSTPSPKCRRLTRHIQPLKILFFRSWPLSKRKNSQATRQPEIKFWKTFWTTAARNLDVPNLLLHSPINLYSITPFYTSNHVTAQVKHLSSTMLSWNSYLKRHDRIWNAKGGQSCRTIDAQRGLSTTLPCLAICEWLFWKPSPYITSLTLKFVDAVNLKWILVTFLFSKFTFALVELVEQRIATIGQHTQGTLLFDGWSCNDMQFAFVMITYCSSVHIREGDNINSKSRPRPALLALSPMEQVSRTAITRSNHLQFGNTYPFLQRGFSFLWFGLRNLDAVPYCGQHRHEP